MERRAFDVLGKRDLLCEDRAVALAHYAGNRRHLRQALLLDQQFQRTEAAAAGRHLEHSSLVALGIDHGEYADALDQAAPCDRGRQVFD